jgi:hypothetical protein
MLSIGMQMKFVSALVATNVVDELELALGRRFAGLTLTIKDVDVYLEGDPTSVPGKKIEIIVSEMYLSDVVATIKMVCDVPHKSPWYQISVWTGIP